MDSMKRVGKAASLVLIIMMIYCLLPVGGSVSESSREVGWWTLERVPREGEQQVVLRLNAEAGRVQAGVFSKKESLTASVALAESHLTILLVRPLKAGEEITVVVEGPDGLQEQTSACVSSLFSSRLTNLRSRVDQMWESWEQIRREYLDKGLFPLPHLWNDIPFLTWADEAPELVVMEDGDHVRIYMNEEETDGWEISLGYGIPMSYTLCVWDESIGAYTSDGPFDSVCLTSAMDSSRLAITIQYDRENDFLPSYPVVEWGQETESDQIGLSVYGWGTTRSFQGGMYFLVCSGYTLAAEYNAEGVLVNYSDLMTNCTYSSEDTIISGREPEGYINPVVH